MQINKKQLRSLGSLSVSIRDINEKQSNELKKAALGLASIEKKLPQIRSQSKFLVLAEHEKSH